MNFVELSLLIIPSLINAWEVTSVEAITATSLRGSTLFSAALILFASLINSAFSRSIISASVMADLVELSSSELIEVSLSIDWEILK